MVSEGLAIGAATRADDPIPIAAFTGICCIGRGRRAISSALRSGISGLQPNRFGDGAADIRTFTGPVAAVEREPLPAPLSAWDCRNHRLAWMTLHEDGFAATVAATAQRVGRSRIGVFIGTSTSGILDTEELFRNGEQQQLDSQRYEHRHGLGSVADFVAIALSLDGARHCVSTACSSSAKVFATAARYLAAGLCDAAIVGGVDSLCWTTLQGFRSLELLSEFPARPFALDRSGISIGEGAAFALLAPGSVTQSALLGVGESSDGYHMSTPHPDGVGAIEAMMQALDRAGLHPADVDYINLHGTGTRANDRVESEAVAQVFGRRIACSSTKGATGHCLGAAGAIEALICDLALEQQMVPGNIGADRSDPELPLTISMSPVAMPVQRVLSNSFGFGGSNCSLLFGAPASRVA